jgi:hypothetical protein
MGCTLDIVTLTPAPNQANALLGAPSPSLRQNLNTQVLGCWVVTTLMRCLLVPRQGIMADRGSTASPTTNYSLFSASGQLVGRISACAVVRYNDEVVLGTSLPQVRP